LPPCATRETIDSELRLLAAVRRVCRECDGSVPSMTLVDELLDERSEADRKLTALSKIFLKHTPFQSGLH
jgi:hypothetical protein